MKQLIPTSLDEYIAEHKEGDVAPDVTDVSSGRAKVELGDVPPRAGWPGSAKEEEKPVPTKSISVHSPHVAARWKSAGVAGAENRRPAQWRSAAGSRNSTRPQKIELELA
jgi:small subunit ribosomal protein S1